MHCFSHNKVLSIKLASAIYFGLFDMTLKIDIEWM